MAKTHKIRARSKQGVAEVRVLLKHPMETGNRKDPKTGEKIPRYFIRELFCEHNGTSVMTSEWGWGISTNPFFSFRLRNAKPGDKIKVSWVDNKDKEDAVEATIK